MKVAKIIMCLVGVLILSNLSAQEYYELAEGDTKTIGDFEIRYKANLKRTKKGWDQYEVRFSIKNNGADVIRVLSRAGETGAQYNLAYVKFPNARRGLLRNTEGGVGASPILTEFYYTYPNCNYDPNDKDSKKYLERVVTETVGYGIRSGQTISGTIDMSVEEGEAVEVEVALNDYYGLEW